MSEFRIDQITNQAGTAGPQIAGITTFSGSSGLVMPSGDTYYGRYLTEDPFYDSMILGIPFNEPTKQAFFDYSKYAITMDPIGSISIDTGESKFYGSSATLDGNGDGVRTPLSGSSYSLGLGSFTAEAWIRCTDFSHVNYLLVANTVDEVSNDGYGFAFGLSGTTGIFTVNVQRNNGADLTRIFGTTSPAVECTETFETNTWTHICMTYDATYGSQGEYRAYKNGKLIGTKDDSPRRNFGETRFYVGKTHNSTHNFEGQLQDVKLYRGAVKYPRDKFDVPGQMAR